MTRTKASPRYVPTVAPVYLFQSFDPAYIYSANFTKVFEHLQRDGEKREISNKSIVSAFDVLGRW